MPFGLDASTLGLIFSGVGSAVGGILGNRAQNSSINNALATQSTGNAEAQKVLWDMYQQGRSDLAPYRSVGKNSLKQLEYLTYGKNLSDFSDAAPAGTGGGYGSGGGFNLNDPTAPGTVPGSIGGQTGFQAGNLSQYQNPAGNALKGLAAGAGATLGIAGVTAAMGLPFLGAGSLLAGPFAPIIFGLGLAAEQLFGRHNDDKLRATDLTNNMSKILWGDSHPNNLGSGGIAALLRNGVITPQQAATATQNVWNAYAAKLPTLADSWTTQNSLQDQMKYFGPFLQPQGWSDWVSKNPAAPASPTQTQQPNQATQDSQAYREEMFGGPRTAPPPPAPKTNALAPPPSNPPIDMVRGHDGAFAPMNQQHMGQPMASMMAKDTVPAMLQPKEYVLTPQAADAIGRPNLDRLNAMAPQAPPQFGGSPQGTPIPPEQMQALMAQMGGLGRMNPMGGGAPMHFAMGGTVPRPGFTLQDGYYIRNGAENQGVTADYLKSQSRFNTPGMDAVAQYNKSREAGMPQDMHSSAGQDYAKQTTQGIGDLMGGKSIPGFSPVTNNQGSYVNPLAPVPRMSTGGIGGTPVTIKPPAPPPIQNALNGGTPGTAQNPPSPPGAPTTPGVQWQTSPDGKWFWHNGGWVPNGTNQAYSTAAPPGSVGQLNVTGKAPTPTAPGSYPGSSSSPGHLIPGSSFSLGPNGERIPLGVPPPAQTNGTPNWTHGQGGSTSSDGKWFWPDGAAQPQAIAAGSGPGQGTSAFYPYGGGGFRAMTPQELQAAGIPAASQLTPQQAQSFGMHVPANSPLQQNTHPAPFPNTSSSQPGGLPAPGNTTGGVTPVPTNGPPGGVPPPSQYGNYPVGYIPTHMAGPDGTDYTTSPLYQLQLREGEKNLDRWLLAHGRANSTYATNAHNSLSENLLANEADKIYQRVQYLTGLGYGAAGQSSQSANNFGQQLSNMILMNALNQGQLQLGQGANNAQLAGNLGSLPAWFMSMLQYVKPGQNQNALAPYNPQYQTGYASM